jgi:hypothetical protein
MEISAVSIKRKTTPRMGIAQGRFGRNSLIPPEKRVKTGDKSGNPAFTPVPMTLPGRYYSHSKPGGPLSQDTHTSSGLSIYGLGVGV